LFIVISANGNNNLLPNILISDLKSKIVNLIS
jgi:hypothetical protein